MKKMIQAGGAAAAALTTISAMPAMAVEAYYEEPVYESYGQEEDYSSDYYVVNTGWGQRVIEPETYYYDYGYIYSADSNYYMYVEDANKYTMLQPNFGNVYAWSYAPTGYNIPELWGQCTWFAWCRFYEIYGFDPGFTGDGWQVAGELVETHPDLFELSYQPLSGAVFSSGSGNHCGMVLWTDGYNMLIQEGNLDGVSNDWTTATEDYWTREITLDQLRSQYGYVQFANPIEGVF
ncbi:MAG: CHAP domain-containing protein [Erysipelotrichaceae bacterium]|nr:CHAP domain-containing protein [Erysipelotrichaceae bacterium]